jgi:chemotaxis methyl-accepting protein methylase
MRSALANWTTPGSVPAMDDTEFGRWVDLLERRTGVVVPPGRKSFLVAAVRTRMREAGRTSYRDYFDEILAGPRGAIEWATLVDRLTVHQTHFFRHPPSLDLVARDWLPGYRAAQPDAPIHAWSVGCATGEEAFTLAMVLDRALAGAGKAYFGITATDISAAALAVGRGATYPIAKLDEVPPAFRAAYCAPAGEVFAADGSTRPAQAFEEADSFTIVESLRRRVGFVQFNLLDAARAPLKRLDLIYCQNVLIYFARERRAGLLQALAGLLKPGGLLVLGAGEVLGFSHPQFTRLGGPQTLAFRRNA